jgi:hypothetical protein
VLGIVALTGLGAAAGSVAATPALGSGGCASASSYDYDPDTRQGLIARRSAFDPSDGLQRWERLLLAMDPNGTANVGR